MQHVTDGPVDPVSPRADSETLEDTEHVDLAIAGMGCPSCGNRIRNALLGTASVVEVQVDVPAALARVWYDPSGTTVGELVAAVRVVGAATHHRYIAVPVGYRRREGSGG